LLAITTCGIGAEPKPVTIMTQNMSAGTDLTYAIYGLLGYIDIPTGVEMTYQEVQASDISQRAAMLAAAVAKKKPDLLALQEVTLWRTGPTATTATAVFADQLQSLLDSLAANQVPYDIVAVNNVGDLALPKLSGGVLRMTDRNALLVRADLRPPDFNLSDIHAALFDSAYSLGGLQVPSGWISAMVHSGNRHFRLFTTHLQSPVAGDPTAAAIQLAQAQQLLHEARNSTVPVVIAGDFNSDAILGESGPGPDNTGTAAMIQAAGYTDVWKMAGSGAGQTWPYYLEDQFPPPPFVAHSLPFERIDLIFSQGLTVLSAERIVAPGPNILKWPYYASDHAGVLAAVQF
jgi:endonuclease/exonuclease/phosphatase family metal-dependent hydrolase